MSLSRRAVLAGALSVPVLATTGGCAGTVASRGDLSRLRVMAPASPGGGWDTTARVMQRVIQQAGLARNVQVFNVDGAGGTIGLGPAGPGDRQRAADDDGPGHGRRGRDQQVAGQRSTDVTPIARLIGEAGDHRGPEELAVQLLKEFVAAWTREPAGTADRRRLGRWHRPDPRRAAGQGRRRGPEADQLHRLLRWRRVARGAARQQGGGRHLRHRRVRRAGASTATSRAGRLQRASAPPQVPDVPTIKEAGLRGRGLQLARGAGPPGHAPPRPRTKLIDLVSQMHESEEWRDGAGEERLGGPVPDR